MITKRQRTNDKHHKKDRHYHHPHLDMIYDLLANIHLITWPLDIIRILVEYTVTDVFLLPDSERGRFDVVSFGSMSHDGVAMEQLQSSFGYYPQASVPIRINDTIYLTGGCDYLHPGKIHVTSYHIPTQVWSTFTQPIPLSVINHTVVKMSKNQGSFMVVGGRSMDCQTGLCQVYNTLSNSWKHTSSLLVPRECHTCVELNGHIYVFGGHSMGKGILSCKKHI